MTPSLGALVAVLLVIVLLNSASTTIAVVAPVRVRTVAAFSIAAKQTPENLAIADAGTIYVSLAFAGEILRIAPSGAEMTLPMPTHGGITLGVAIDRRHGGNIDVAIRSSDPAAAGIWRVPRATFSHPARIAPLPTDSFPNGITFDQSGNLYIADSALGRIWRLAPGASRATVWSNGKALAPTGASFKNFPLPGANGIKVWHNQVYVSNTSTQSILTVPINRGGRAGRIKVRVRHIQADDFAFAANGDLYVALNPLSKLVRISPVGRQITLATHTDGLQNTSAVAFDPRAGRRQDLYLTNSSYFGSSPSLQQMRTNTIGLRLP